MSRLFSPLDFGPLRLSNRIVIAPMCQYSAEEGRATDWHAFHWPNLAQSGAGLAIVEATAVLPEGRISWADLGLWDDTTEAAFARALAATRRYSKMPLGVQLAHAGRKASTHRPWEHGGAQIPPEAPHGWQTVSASPLPYSAGQHPPHALDQAGIDAVIAAFAASARRAARLGLDLIEIHAAHGYLLHQFYSPLSNRRDDDWGGDFTGRTRLVREVVTAVRAEVPADRALFVRISATDWAEGGWDVPDSVRLAADLKRLGVDLVDVSSGGNVSRVAVRPYPGYLVDYATAVRTAGIPAGTVGLITEPEQAQAIITGERADAVFVARAALRNPYWALHAAHELGATPQFPDQYVRGAW